MSITDLNNWMEIAKGIYKYVLDESQFYEIHILRHKEGDDIKTATSNLYLVGDWIGKMGTFFVRECFLSKKPLSKCLERAMKDYRIRKLLFNN